MANSAFSKAVVPTPVSLANGGTGATLTSPGADRIVFWDDSANTITWLDVANGLAVSGTTLTLPYTLAGSGTVTNSGTTALTGFTGSGTTSGTNTGDQTTITGNAATATKWATARTLAITGDLAYTSPSFDGSANVTAAGTLANVNGNIGTFANATVIVNAKGLVTAAAAGPSTASTNVLHNGDFAVCQRGTSLSVADGAYGADRWYVLNTNATTFSRQDGMLGSRYGGRLNQDNVTAQRMGMAQIIEGQDAIPYRNRTVRFQATIKTSTATSVRMAILEWSGTENTVTRDVVNNWASTTYTAGNFFIGTVTVNTVSATLAASTSNAVFNISGSVGSSANNIIVFVWTENTAAQNVQITVTEAGLYDGNATQPWLPRPASQEVAICKRYFIQCNSVDIGLAANNTLLSGMGTIWYPSEMRITPALSGAFIVNAGSAGTPGYSTSTTQMAALFNSATNWTTGAIVKFTGNFTADL